MKQPNTLDRHRVLVAFSMLEQVCKHKSCSECPLEPYDDEQYCAFTLLKDRVELLNEAEVNR